MTLPTHLYDYRLEGLPLQTYVWLSERAQAENHPDLPTIRSHIHFDVCPRPDCGAVTTMSFHQDVVQRDMRKHIIAWHPLYYIFKKGYKDGRRKGSPS